MTDLRHRDTALPELMDDPTCDEQALRRTDARFAVVDRLVGGWRGTYRALLRPRLSGRAAAAVPAARDLGPA